MTDDWDKVDDAIKSGKKKIRESVFKQDNDHDEDDDDD